MKVAILLALICTVLGEEFAYQGLMLSYSKDHLAKDMFELAQAISHNAMSFNFSDISIEEDYGSGKSGLYISDIKFIASTFFFGDLGKNAFYSQDDHKFTIKSGEAIIQYDVSFSWRVTALGMNIEIGTGLLKAASESFAMSIFLPNPAAEDKTFTGELNTEFAFRIAKITGDYTGGSTRQWILNLFKTNVSKELTKAEKESEHLIKKFLFASFLKAHSTQNNVAFRFENHPVDTREIQDYIWIAFSTKIKLADGTSYSIKNKYYIKDLMPETGQAVYLSVENVVGALSLLSSLPREIDPTEFGYSGKIKDFFSALPELGLRHNPDTKITILCKALEIQPLPTGAIMITKCDFIADHDTFLMTKTTSNLKILPRSKSSTQGLVGVIEECELEHVTTEPSNLNAGLFISQFFLRYQKAKVVNTLLPIPNVSYKPLRENYEMITPNKTDYYVAYYKFLD